ncbi:MAG: hypothetical protein ACJAS1_000551 [Oleiphilaceae bacterium]|jgi:hypothetical protein
MENIQPIEVEMTFTFHETFSRKSSVTLKSEKDGTMKAIINSLCAVSALKIEDGEPMSIDTAIKLYVKYSQASDQQIIHAMNSSKANADKVMQRLEAMKR